MTGIVAFTDVETTGLHPELHEIYEVGLILPDGAEHRWWLPVDLAQADPFALEIGKFHERHPHGYSYRAGEDVPDAAFIDHGLMEPAAFALQFSVLTFRKHIAGAVVSFDAERLARLLRSHGRSPDWHYHIIDVEALAVGYITGHDRRQGVDPWFVTEPPWNSDELSEALGIKVPDGDRHTALGDCRWARAIYETVMAR